MIHCDGIVTDSLGANAFLAMYFSEEDLINEVAHQILAQKQYEGLDIWDMR